MTTPSRLFLCLATLACVSLVAADAEGRTPRYRRRPNLSQCQSYSWRPKAKSVPGGRAANPRVPLMTNSIHNYLTLLNARGCGLTVQSTFRDCVTNSSVGGAQKSRHLCGAGADTAGCSKPIARSTCSRAGLHYIEEGSGKFPHCQIDTFCNRINRAREDGPGNDGRVRSPVTPPERPKQANACYYAIFSCAKTQAGAAQEKARLGGSLSVVHTDDVKNFNKGWYCVVSGPGSEATAKTELRKHQSQARGYVKKGC
jgi:hypothetical protein